MKYATSIKRARVFWILAIVTMGLVATMNLLGGIGTICASFFTEQYPSMTQALQGHEWLYQRIVIMTLTMGILGMWVTYGLFRSKKHAYRDAVVMLLIGTLISDLQVTASLNLRGNAAPADIKFYFNIFTMIYFLMLGFPPFDKWIDFSKPGGKNEITAAAGITTIMTGIAVLTVSLWVGTTHSHMEDNWIAPFQPYLLTGGTVLILLGLNIFVKSAATIISQSEQQIWVMAEAQD